MNAIERIEKFERFGSVLGLERIEKLLELLGNPEKELKYIHVAGTNGKGSVCRYIYEALKWNGYKVGLYTSPFLQVFNERIELDGEYITDEELESVTELVLGKAENMVQMGYDSPTEFEIVTAIAFVYFHQKQADYVVLEVGLGGKGDSTNIIENPLISIITSISYDHMDRLGNSLEEIAGEKAGIIKPGVPVVVNVADPAALKVIARKAYENNSVLYDARKIKATNKNMSIDGTTFDLMIYGTDYSEVSISMLGEHQVENVKVALLALELLRKSKAIQIERGKLYEGLKHAVQIGRFEILNKDPLLVLDGAHNQAGAQALAECIAAVLPEKKILFVLGILEDKDSEGIVRELCKISKNFISTEPNNPRKMTSERLSDIINGKNGTCISIPDLREACKRGLEMQSDFDAIVFAGSLYLIGEVRGILKDEWKS